MLQILHFDSAIDSMGSERKKKHISRIMNDLEAAGIFSEDDKYEDPLCEVEELADEIFNEGKDPAVEREQNENEETVNPFSEARIRAKRRDLAVRGFPIELTDEDFIDCEGFFPDTPSEVQEVVRTTRYGRTPLHEAIVLRDIDTVKFFVEQGKYKSDVDNNGASAYNMAVYENFTEAIEVLKQNGYGD